MTKLSGLILTFFLCLSGCASVETRLPTPDIRLLAKESGAQEQQAFVRYIDMLERLDRIGTKVFLANAELCKKTVPDIGLVTHTVKSYPKHLRASAAQYIGARETPTVLLVRKNSTAEALGFTVGDEIVDEAGKPISFLGKKSREYFDNTGQVRRRDNSELGYEILKPEADVKCGYPMVLKFSGAVNAYANGKSIIVTTGMMDFAERDEELALVVGHELAHNTMRHVPKSIRNLLLSGFATRTTRPFESEADYVGLYYMARAGFELDGVEDFWRRLGVKNPKSIVRAKTHPVTPKRLLSIRATAAEIKLKTQSGEALVPNYIKETDIKNGP